MKQYSRSAIVSSMVLPVFIFFVLVSFFTQPAYAHLAGQAPFFKINGEFTNTYPVSGGKNTSIFVFPQDSSPQNYRINQKLTFTLELSQLPFPTDFLPQMSFLWDFGDGTKGTGIKNTHSYSKSGSYTMLVNATPPDSQEPVLLQSTLITILPDKNYRTPKPTILINGKPAKDYPLQFAEADLHNPVSLSVSLEGNSTIASYTWDLDDGDKETAPSFTHQFPQSRSVVTPILRVIDRNGIIVDTSEPIVNKKVATSKAPPYLLPIGGIMAIILLASGILLLRRKKA